MSSFSMALPFDVCHMSLGIYITDRDDKELHDRYTHSINAHNDKVTTNSYPDAGFDLFSPSIEHFIVGKPRRLNLGIKCCAQLVMRDGTCQNTGYMLFPRSSISKTSLRLSNSAGVIDSGYRGELMCAFDCFYRDHMVAVGDRLVQIVAPGMVPIHVKLLSSEDELGLSTERGDGGFGSTGV